MELKLTDEQENVLHTVLGVVASILHESSLDEWTGDDSMADKEQVVTDLLKEFYNEDIPTSNSAQCVRTTTWFAQGALYYVLVRDQNVYSDCVGVVSTDNQVAWMTPTHFNKHFREIDPRI